MAKCGLVETRKGKTLPACKETLFTEKGKLRCSVHCRGKLRGERAGKLCVNHHRKGKRGCRMHGGNAKVGLASPQLKTGEYSRYLQVLSPSMLERFKGAQSNRDYLSLTPDIHMIQSRIELLVERAETTNETGQAWNDARAAFDAFIKANEEKNKAGTMTALAALNKAIQSGTAEYNAWSEVCDLWTRLQRLVESERKRALECGELLQMSIVLGILRSVAGLVRENVTDEIALTNITTGLRRITGGSVNSLDQTRRSGNGKSAAGNSALVASPRK